MTEITIIVTPAFDHRGKRRHDRFDARLQGGDEIICEATRQPLLDASRLLLSRGADRTAAICMVYASAPAVVTMRATIGVAAQYAVMGEKLVRRKPAVGPMAGSGIGNALSAVPAGLINSNPSLRASNSGPSETASPPPAGIVDHIQGLIKKAGVSCCSRRPERHPSTAKQRYNDEEDTVQSGAKSRRF
jgi:hypothetical protein